MVVMPICWGQKRGQIDMLTLLQLERHLVGAISPGPCSAEHEHMPVQ
jgi:hypothetical protein